MDLYKKFRAKIFDYDWDVEPKLSRRNRNHAHSRRWFKRFGNRLVRRRLKSRFVDE